VLLSKTLRSSTLRLALIYVFVFSALIFGLLGYVYWSTLAYLHEKSDLAVIAGRTPLLDDLDRFREKIAVGLAFGAGVLLLLAVAAGISTSRRSVARIEAVNAISRKIMREGLGERIPVRGTGDEWDGLAENLNSMLDRIEELIETNRQVPIISRTIFEHR
jgi:methyl-accepting chemotaxis protein